MSVTTVTRTRAKAAAAAAAAADASQQREPQSPSPPGPKQGAAALPPPKAAGHSAAFTASGALPGVDAVLPLRRLLIDPAFLVFVGLHLVALAAPLLYGLTWRDVALVFATYNARMFGITGGFHRLLSHRSFRTSRALQFAFAWLGTAALQKGPLWWCSHHRHHHRTADTAEDAHSPVQHGFFWSHIGWWMCTDAHTHVLWGAVPDLAALPELRWLERHYLVPPAALAAGLFAAGGGRAAVYGFGVSTVLCWHATYAINSVAHLQGTRLFGCEFNGACTARNNLVLALLTLGEGWHNNHHRCMASVQHGFRQPWQVDVTFYVVKALETLGLAWGLRAPPAELVAAARAGTREAGA